MKKYTYTSEVLRTITFKNDKGVLISLIFNKGKEYDLPEDDSQVKKLVIEKVLVPVVSGKAENPKEDKKENE